MQQTETLTEGVQIQIKHSSYKRDPSSQYMQTRISPKFIINRLSQQIKTPWAQTREANIICAKLERMHVDANCVEVLPAAPKETYNTAVVLHGDTERGPVLLPKWPICFYICDKFNRCYDIGSIVCAKCSGNFLQKLWTGEFNLHERNITIR